jgi:hypothetical protein
MAFRNQLASPSAVSLGLFSNPVAVPVLLTAAGVAITATAAVVTYKAYEHYKEKKHRAEIERINELHKTILTRILIPDFNEVQSLPPIFKLVDNKDSSNVQSLHYTDDDVRRIGETLPHGTDIGLTTYKQSILDAILKLKEYYFSRKKHNDITAGVISYLLNMLQTHCLNFEGYNYDIALLTALSKFVNEYASLYGEKSQHFSHLNIVFSCLQTAIQDLERHKEKMSLEEMLGELRDSCIDENNRLIRGLAKMVTENEKWQLINTFLHKELTQGLLRREYVHSEVKLPLIDKQLILDTDHEKQLSPTIFRPWLMKLSQYFLDTLDPDTNLNGDNVLSPVKMFTYPDLDRLKQLRTIKKPNIQEKQELEILEHELDKIRKLFSHSQNFITTKLDKSKKKPTFISISDDEELIERTKILAEFGTLIHKSISLQYLCTHLLKSTKQLGEIYVKNPHHFRRIFFILEELCKQITDSVDAIIHKFADIQRSKQNNMQIAEKELFPIEVQEILNSLQGRVSSLGLRIKVYRERVAKHLNPEEPTIQSVKHEMFEVATLLSEMYHIIKAASMNQEKFVPGKDSDTLAESSEETSTESNLAASSQARRKHPNEDKQDSDRKLDKPMPAREQPDLTMADKNKRKHKRKDKQPVSESLMEDQHDEVRPSVMAVSKEDPEPILNHGVPEQRESGMQRNNSHEPPIQQALPDTEDDPHLKLETINTIMSSISQRLLTIQRTEKPDNSDLRKVQFYNAELIAYKLLRENLLILQKKSEELADEPDKTTQRIDKVNKTLSLIITVFNQTNQFLELNHEDRLANAAAFSQHIHTQLADVNNHFLDNHNSDFWKGVYSICSISVFGTDTRKKMTTFGEACDNLARTAVNIRRANENIAHV